MEKMEKGSALEMAALEQVIGDIEYLRSHGCYPWAGASGRRAMEERYTYSAALQVYSKAVDIDLSTTVSCSYVRYKITVKIDGSVQRQYLKALRALTA